ncbi:hypothetical protein CEE45_13335 [Candidatus Heimdallarchaeota archaeon B3_Heim]|nr:MAG: hypothetical protein CEE45_13335 [Candidatus Heimdallarchaeota archaeon B3_Heim]
MFRNLPIIKPIEYTNSHLKPVEKQNIHLFCVQTHPDKLHPIPFSSEPLNEDMVYLFINDVLRKIFLWVGTTASIRSKFVGAHSAIVLQRKTGITYRVENIDEDHESADFRRTISVFEA